MLRKFFPLIFCAILIALPLKAHAAQTISAAYPPTITTINDTGINTGCNFTADGLLDVPAPPDRTDINGSISTSRDDQGTVRFGGYGNVSNLGGPCTVTGAAGAQDAAINNFYLDFGSNLVIKGDTYVSNVEFNPSGAIEIDGNAHIGTIDNILQGSFENDGTLTFGGNATVSGTVGASGVNGPITTVNVNGGLGKVVDLQGDTWINTLNFGNGGRVQIEGVSNLGSITTTNPDTGAITFAGNGTVTGNVGGPMAELDAFNVGTVTASPTVECQGAVWALSRSSIVLKFISPHLRAKPIYCLRSKLTFVTVLNKASCINPSTCVSTAPSSLA